MVTLEKNDSILEGPTGGKVRLQNLGNCSEILRLRNPLNQGDRFPKPPKLKPNHYSSRLSIQLFKNTAEICGGLRCAYRNSPPFLRNPQKPKLERKLRQMKQGVAKSVRIVPFPSDCEFAFFLLLNCSVFRKSPSGVAVTASLSLSTLSPSLYSQPIFREKSTLQCNFSKTQISGTLQRRGKGIPPPRLVSCFYKVGDLPPP
jgi:hypothetical protein